MKRLILLVGLSLVASLAQAQSATDTIAVDIFLSTASNPAVDPAMAAEAIYPASALPTLCGQTKVTPPPMPVNPTILQFTDPTDPAVPPTKVCAVNVATQVSALAPGTYKAALKLTTSAGTSLWSGFTNSFQRAVVAPPPSAPLNPQLR